MKIVLIWRFIKESWGALITLLIPILISIDFVREFLGGHFLRWLIPISLLIVGFIHTKKSFENKESLEELSSRFEYRNSILLSNLESIPRTMIKEFSKYLNLSNEYRITLYRVKEKKSFVPVARYSESPIYREDGRSEYPIDRGFIGQCWEKGEIKKDSLPSYERNPARYIRESVKQSNMYKTEINSLGMKSSSFYCKRLDYNGDEPLAIVVIETTKTRLGLDINVLREYLEGPFGKTLSDTVKMNSPIGEEESLWLD